MKKFLSILACVLAIPLLVWAGVRLDTIYTRALVGDPVDTNSTRALAGDPTRVTNDIGKPYAVLTIDYGEPVEGFVEGEFYVLKVLKVRGTKIDYGFCPIRRDGYYDKENKP